MNRKRILILLCLFCSYLIACNSTQKKTVFSGTSKEIGYTLSDTLKLYRDSLNFRFTNMEKVDKDSILAFNYPLLDLTLINRNIDVLKSISRKSDIKDGFTGSFIDPVWAGKQLFVFQHGNASSFSVYDKELNFKKNTKLLGEIYPYFLPTINSQAILINESVNKYEFLISVSRLDVSQNAVEFYKTGYTFLRMSIDTSGNILKKEFVLPYMKFDEITGALDENLKSWDGAFPVFDYHNGSIYLFYEFSDKLFIYDTAFNKRVEIPVMWPDYEWRRESKPFIKKGTKSDIGESIKNSFYLRYAKPYLIDMKYKDGLVFMHFIKPISEEGIPQNSVQERDFIYETFLLIIDPKDYKNQKYIDLKNNFSPYSKIYPVGRNSIYLYGNFKKTDNYELINLEIK